MLTSSTNFRIPFLKVNKTCLQFTFQNFIVSMPGFHDRFSNFVTVWDITILTKLIMCLRRALEVNGSWSFTSSLPGPGNGPASGSRSLCVSHPNFLHAFVYSGTCFFVICLRNPVVAVFGEYEGSSFFWENVRILLPHFSI